MLQEVFIMQKKILINYFDNKRVFKDFYRLIAILLTIVFSVTYLGNLSAGAIEGKPSMGTAINYTVTADTVATAPFQDSTTSTEASVSTPATESKGDSVAKDEPKVIVSLTSYPARYKLLPYSLKSLANQTVKPDKIILNLCTQENTEQDKLEIYELLKSHKLDGVITINWIDEKIGPHGKLIPTLKLHPEDIIIVVDDDHEYYSDLVSDLLKKHKQFPDCIISNICSGVENIPLYFNSATPVNTPLIVVLIYGVCGFYVHHIASTIKFLIQNFL